MMSSDTLLLAAVRPTYTISRLYFSIFINSRLRGRVNAMARSVMVSATTISRHQS